MRDFLYFSTSSCIFVITSLTYRSVYQGRNCFFDRALVDVHFAQLIAEVDLRDYYTVAQLEEKYNMSHQAVLSFVQRNKIPRITQGRTVYYSRAHVDTIKGEREAVDPNYYTYAEVMEKYHFTGQGNPIGNVSVMTEESSSDGSIYNSIPDKNMLPLCLFLTSGICSIFLTFGNSIFDFQ